MVVATNGGTATALGAGAFRNVTEKETVGKTKDAPIPEHLFPFLKDHPSKALRVLH